jgi:hypothetical protein
VIGSVLNSSRVNFFELLDLAVLIGLIVVFVDAALKREDAYRAAGKLTKPGWLIILGVAIAASFLLGLLFTIAGVVAAMVYWVDVRPALKEVSGSSRKGGRNRYDRW